MGGHNRYTTKAGRNYGGWVALTLKPDERNDLDEATLLIGETVVILKRTKGNKAQLAVRAPEGMKVRRMAKAEEDDRALIFELTGPESNYPKEARSE